MPRRNAPIKSVSGQPFGFETRVGAQMFAHLLAGSAVMHGEFGRLVQIRFYQRSAGSGEFDDLLLFFEKDGAEIKCGLSLKPMTNCTKAAQAPS
jgi:hypothetical protein